MLKDHLSVRGEQGSTQSYNQVSHIQNIISFAISYLFPFHFGGREREEKNKTNEAAFFSEAVIISILQLVSLLELVFGLKSKSQLNRRTATKRVQQKAQLMINQVGAS